MSCNNTLTNNNINSNNGDGVDLGGYSDYNTLINNNANSNEKAGIKSYKKASGLIYVSNYNILRNNKASNNGCGFDFIGYDNVLINNTANWNYEYGINLRGSSNIPTNNTVSSNHNGIRLSSEYSTLRNNRMNNNLYNFDVDGNILADYIQDIDTSNIVNGKPIYYLVNEKNRVIDSLSNAGYVGVVNSSNITVRDLTITNNRQGVFFAYVTDSKVENVIVSNNYMGIYLTKSNNNILINNTAHSNEWFGIYLHYSDSNILTNNIASGTKMASWGNGINLFYSDNNILADNTAYSNNRSGISLDESNNNMVTNNTAYSNNRVGIEMGRLNNNTLTNNTAYYNKHGIIMYSSRNNMVANNDVKSNTITGIYLFVSYNNLIYHNNMINNTKQAYCTGYNNSWDNGYPLGGNYWSDYTGVDLYHGQYQNITGSDGIGDSPYINISGSAGVQDRYPFIKESGWAPISTIFDTGPGTYPSIFGTHNGTIKPNKNITVRMLYTYPCPGTGGHTEYARIWNSSLDINATWNGYVDDWHNISFNEPFTLVKDEVYNYTIRTGSYPQIIHARSKPVTGGLINCTTFTDANGKIYDDWIPAIRLYHNCGIRT